MVLLVRVLSIMLRSNVDEFSNVASSFIRLPMQSVTLTTVNTLMMFVIMVVTMCPATNAQQEWTRSFGAYDSGLKRGEWSPNRQAKLLRELGYDSIVYKGMRDLDRRLKALRKYNVGLQAVQVSVNLDRDSNEYPELEQGMQKLAGTGTIIWVQIKGSDGGDAKAVQILKRLGRQAVDAGLNIAIYPHDGHYTETTPHAVRIVKKVHRSNVGVSFNLCHSLKAGNAEQIPEILSEAAPHLMLVQISGARKESGNWADQGWGQLIRPLDDSTLDLQLYLDHLDRIGYVGPVCLMPYGIDLPPKEHLTRSMSAWKSLQE